MTADASLPPAISEDGPMTDRLTEQEKAANRRKWWGLTDQAEVGTDPAALTDEELAAMEAEYRMYRAYASSRDVPRLIAALRASRAEVERLRSLTDELTQAAHSHLP